ncbi:Crp/Fnr family transcriptional regulator [Taibaiella koreensis]|uniref:Crp/Fnr family transcriptional regulator n=1 Tax=Taibaiella koreensis TaxID=1268548 RepID=UPI000E59FC9C|nr:Crp/Fnr family transcriptional regulator [Taibaiella koreensis]
MGNALIALLQTGRTLTAAEEQLILSAFTEREARRDEVLFPGDKVCRTLFFIDSGVLRLGRTDDKGNDITYFFLKEGQFCTILKSFQDGIIAEEQIIAASEVRLRSVTRIALDTLYEQLPWLRHTLEQLLQRQLMEKIDLRNRFLERDAPGNYQALLEQVPGILLHVSLKDIASYLGITPQSLSRLRKNLL